MNYVEQLLEKRGKRDLFSRQDIEEFQALVMPVDTNISIDSVILSDENKLKIEQFLVEQANKEELSRYKLSPMNRILMYGASGTGKTYLSKALSNHIGYDMLYIDIAASLSDGTVAKNISNIFRLGNALGNCIIFFDEADSIAWNRDSGNPDSGVVRRATNSLFQNLDQMNKSNVFISATNMLHRLDLAFERRFDMKMEFKRPTDIHGAIQKFVYPEFELLDDVDTEKRGIIERLALSSPKLSFYEIQIIVERIMKKAVIDRTFTVRTSEIYTELARAERIKIYFSMGEDSEEETEGTEQVGSQKTAAITAYNIDDAYDKYSEAF